MFKDTQKFIRLNKLRTIIMILSIQSSGFSEPNDVAVLSETFSAQKQIVFSDETHLAFAVSAFSAVFSVVSNVSSPQQVWHLYKKSKIIIFYFIQFFILYISTLKL